MCNLCPRKCKVNRHEGERGFCGADGKTIKISRAALHFWEEPCISGTRGSGAVFFSYCSLKCIYCQNIEISRGRSGAEVDIFRLAEIMCELKDKGAHNINLVTPTHYIDQIILSIDIARKNGMNLPIIYNTSGYELPETIDSLKGYIDIFLTDYKYSNNLDAKRYSGIDDYVEFADMALLKMCDLSPIIFDQDGIMKSGVILRHLLLPGKLTEAKNILKRNFGRFGNKIYYSIMSQYTITKNNNLPEELKRKVSKWEYERLIDYAQRIGIENAYIQDGDAASESFIPPFDLTGVHDK